MQEVSELDVVLITAQLTQAAAGGRGGAGRGQRRFQKKEASLPVLQRSPGIDYYYYFVLSYLKPLPLCCLFPTNL